MSKATANAELPQASVLIYIEHADIDPLLVENIRNNVSQVVVTDSSAKIQEAIMLPDPQLLILCFETFEIAMGHYSRITELLYLKDLAQKKFVIACSRHDEEKAYAAVKANLIDDYILSRPLYEKNRPFLVCRQLLHILGDTAQMQGNKNKALEALNLNEALEKKLAEFQQTKLKIQQNMAESIKQIEASLNKAEQSFKAKKRAELDVKEVLALLSKIRSDDIRPELLNLQQKAISLLENFAKKAAPTPTSEQAPAAQKEEAPQAKVPLHDIPEKKQGIRVLLVEDDPISLNITQRLFSAKDFELHTAMNGREALYLSQKQSFDVCFMDINLPDSDGILIASQIHHTDNDNVNLPIVMLTGNKSKVSVERSKIAGAISYIVKPLSVNALHSVLKKLGLDERLAK